MLLENGKRSSSLADPIQFLNQHEHDRQLEIPMTPRKLEAPATNTPEIWGAT
jgi:hypothetical protein